MCGDDGQDYLIGIIIDFDITHISEGYMLQMWMFLGIAEANDLINDLLRQSLSPIVCQGVLKILL